jgi:hypothetical protein
VVATHGRGVFVTDITPLQEADSEVLAQPYHLFTPEPKARRVESGWGNYRFFGWRHITTPNEPNGVLLDVYQRGEGTTPISLRVQDSEGNEVWAAEEPGAAGLHRVVLPLQGRGRQAPALEPGDYTVTMNVGDLSQSRTLVVKPPVILPRK